MVTINTAARYAIANLRSINEELQTTQNRISSGLKISSAKDDPTVWRAAMTIRSDLSTHAAVDKSLTSAKASVDAAASATDAISNALTNLGAKLAAYASASDKTTAFAAITDAQAQITAATNFSGATNLINNTTAYSYASSVGASGAVVLSTLTPVDAVTAATATAIGGTNSLATFLTTFTKTQLDVAQNATDIGTALSTATTAVSNYAAVLGSASNRIASQQATNKALTAVKESALSSMVDADLEEESARLEALKTKQQLSYQALNLANQSGQNILRLFQ